MNIIRLLPPLPPINYANHPLSGQDALSTPAHGAPAGIPDTLPIDIQEEIYAQLSPGDCINLGSINPHFHHLVTRFLEKLSQEIEKRSVLMVAISNVREKIKAQIVHLHTQLKSLDVPVYVPTKLKVPLNEPLQESSRLVQRFAFECDRAVALAEHVQFFIFAEAVAQQLHVFAEYKAFLHNTTGEDLVQQRKLAWSFLKVRHSQYPITELILNGKHLSFLPPEIGELTQLRILNLSGNQLKELPATFGNLTQLIRLFLGGNQLKELLATFGNLNQLTELYLNANQLKELPATFGNLTGLTDLNLDGNQLVRLPSEFWNLTQLIKLDLGNNQLPQSVSAEFSRLTHLKTCNFSGNPTDSDVRS